jgi:hypothetical protein
MVIYQVKNAVGRARLLPSFFGQRHNVHKQKACDPLLVNGRWRPEKAPQERRPPEDRKRTSNKMFRAVVGLSEPGRVPPTIHAAS